MTTPPRPPRTGAEDEAALAEPRGDRQPPSWDVERAWEALRHEIDGALEDTPFSFKPTIARHRRLIEAALRWEYRDYMPLDEVRALQATRSGDGGLDEAWRAAEAALPEGWSLSAGSILNDRTHGRRVVYWAGAGPLLEDPDTLLGGKATPAAALSELAERLRTLALGGHDDTPD